MLKSKEIINEITSPASYMANASWVSGYKRPLKTLQSPRFIVLLAAADTLIETNKGFNTNETRVSHSNPTFSPRETSQRHELVLFDAEWKFVLQQLVGEAKDDKGFVRTIVNKWLDV